MCCRSFRIIMRLFCGFPSGRRRILGKPNMLLPNVRFSRARLECNFSVSNIAHICLAAGSGPCWPRDDYWSRNYEQFVHPGGWEENILQLKPGKNWTRDSLRKCQDRQNQITFDVRSISQLHIFCGCPVLIWITTWGYIISKACTATFFRELEIYMKCSRFLSASYSIPVPSQSTINDASSTTISLLHDWPLVSLQETFGQKRRRGKWNETIGGNKWQFLLLIALTAQFQRLRVQLVAHPAVCNYSQGRSLETSILRPILTPKCLVPFWKLMHISAVADILLRSLRAFLASSVDSNFWGFLGLKGIAGRNLFWKKKVKYKAKKQITQKENF